VAFEPTRKGLIAMTPIDYALWFVFGLILVWVFGGIALRLGGLLFMFGGGLSMARDPHGGALVVLGLGALCWLLGHWLYAVRHHEFKSPLARYLFCRWAPAWADPTHNWAVATEPERSRRDLTARDGGATRSDPDLEGGTQ
jgi:hypothetical protein